MELRSNNGSMQHLRSYVLIFVLCLLPTSVSADLFSTPPTDKSLEFLGYIFGNRVGSVYLGGNPNPALAKMFELFNACIICIGVIIVSYIGIVSTMNTAQEGKTMGRKFASIWIPMRAALGMAALIPAPTSGYSVIQVSVMWLILQGVGAADHIWQNVLHNLSTGVGVSSHILDRNSANRNQNTYSKLNQDGTKLAEALLHTAVCTHTLNSMQHAYKSRELPDASVVPQLVGKVKMYATKSPLTTTDTTAQIKGTVYFGVPGNEQLYDICGKYEIAAQVDSSEWPKSSEPRRVSKKELEQHADALYEHKRLAIALMYQELSKVAHDIVQQQMKPRNSNNRLQYSNTQERFEPKGHLLQAINIYTQELTNMVIPHPRNELQDIVHAGNRHGWISAGSFYFALNKSFNVNFFKNITVAPTMELVPVCKQSETNCGVHFPDDSDELNGRLRNALRYSEEKNYIAARLWDAHQYLACEKANLFADRNKHSKQPLTIDVNEYTAAQAAEQAGIKRLHTEFYNDLQNMLFKEQHQDPLIAQGKFGAEVMRLSEESWLNKQAEATELQNRIKEGSLPATEENLRYLHNLTSSGTFFLTIYGFVWTLGATLAIYAPLVPYMMFAVGVLGWLLLVIEAVVAAPILTLSFILPGGEELGKIMNGLMLLLNIVLRPTLMLFGFVLATRLYGAVVDFVNFSMVGNFSNLGVEGSLFAWMAVATLYIGFIVTLANKCFALIYGLPDKILRWMGGAPEHSDASQELQQTKGMMNRGADTIHKISTGFAEGGFARLQNRSKQLPKAADAVTDGGKA